MTPPEKRISDEVVDRALWLYEDTDATADPQDPQVKRARARMRRTLEAVWPEPTFTDDEIFALRLGVRHLLGEPTAVDLTEINPLWRLALARLGECANGL